MRESEAFWPEWISTIRKINLVSPVATLLESVGPFKILAVQMLYISQPFLSSATKRKFDAMADLLGQEDELRDFVSRLKG